MTKSHALLAEKTMHELEGSAESAKTVYCDESTQLLVANDWV